MRLPNRVPNTSGDGWHGRDLLVRRLRRFGTCPTGPKVPVEWTSCRGRRGRRRHSRWVGWPMTNPGPSSLGQECGGRPRWARPRTAWSDAPRVVVGPGRAGLAGRRSSRPCTRPGPTGAPWSSSSGVEPGRAAGPGAVHRSRPRPGAGIHLLARAPPVPGVGQRLRRPGRRPGVVARSQGRPPTGRRRGGRGGPGRREPGRTARRCGSTGAPGPTRTGGRHGGGAPLDRRGRAASPPRRGVRPMRTSPPTSWLRSTTRPVRPG